MIPVGTIVKIDYYAQESVLRKRVFKVAGHSRNHYNLLKPLVPRKDDRGWLIQPDGGGFRDDQCIPL